MSIEPPVDPAVRAAPSQTERLVVHDPGDGQGLAPTDAPGRVPDASGRGCTQAQLRRFIKSRPYVPLHELRRRFAIDGPEDDVTAMHTEAGRIFVGLPEREGRMLGELVRHGEVGYELSLDPECPMVMGVYPMRPVPRG
ncbi:MAG: hypothetical protein ACXWMU_03770 [Candidatus Limnocylindrales bacterium]